MRNIRLVLTLVAVAFVLSVLAGCESSNPFEPCPVYSTGVVGTCSAADTVVIATG